MGGASISDRIDKFLTDPAYKLFGFGESVVSEILGNAYPEEYCFYNQRDRVAMEDILDISPENKRGDTFGQAFLKFQNQLKQYGIAEKYIEIVGRRTELPIYYEVDQLFSFLYDHFKTNKEEENDEKELEQRNLSYETVDFFTVGEWQEMMKDRTIFHQENIDYLLEMHHMGGEATQLEMSKKLGKHPSSFISPIVNLAKRISKEMGVSIPVLYNEPTYFNMLFNGGKNKTGHFKWVIKGNLNKALTEMADILLSEVDETEIVDSFAIEEWEEMLRKDAIFRSLDREYMFKMHEWGGGASGTELGLFYPSTLILNEQRNRQHYKYAIWGV